MNPKLLTIFLIFLAAHANAQTSVDEILAKDAELSRLERDIKIEEAKKKLNQSPTAGAGILPLSQNQPKPTSVPNSTSDEIRLTALYGVNHAIHAEILLNNVLYTVGQDGSVGGWTVVELTGSSVVLKKGAKKTRFYLSGTPLAPTLTSAPSIGLNLNQFSVPSLQIPGAR